MRLCVKWLKFPSRGFQHSRLNLEPTFPPKQYCFCNCLTPAPNVGIVATFWLLSPRQKSLRQSHNRYFMNNLWDFSDFSCSHRKSQSKHTKLFSEVGWLTWILNKALHPLHTTENTDQVWKHWASLNARRMLSFLSVTSETDSNSLVSET